MWRKQVVLFLIFGYFVLINLLIDLPDKRFHIYFLDVGQGDSILVKTPENHQILIDGGPGSAVLSELSDVMPFFDKSLDLLILSHPHNDHIEGLVEILKRYDVASVLISGVEYSSEIYREFLLELERQNISVFVAEKSLDFRFGELVIDLIYPENPILSDHFDNLNNSSIAMRVLYGEIVVLLTGDLESDIEKVLVEQYGDILDASILKSPHHGSKTSSILPFLKLVTPEIVVIQSGEGNDYGHPHIETLERYYEIGVSDILRTDLDGRIELVF